MRSRLAIAGRELAGLRREKTIVLAIAIQLFVAAFSSFLVVGLVTLYSPAAAGGAVTVEVGVSGNASDALAPVAAEGDARAVERFDSREAALSAFDAGEVDAVMHATRQPSGAVHVDAYAPSGDFRTTLVVVQLKDALEAFERQQRAAMSHRLSRQPVPVPEEVGGNPYYGFSYTVLVPLLVFLPVFISGSIAADSVSEELERGTFELLRVAPLSVGQILDGKALAAVALAPVQAGAWLALLAVNGTPVAHPLPILALATGATAVVVAAGAFLALATGERRSAQLLYSLGVIVAATAAATLPENPANAVAKLAIGSPTPTTSLVVAGTVAGGAAAYGLARTLADRTA
ncbi:MAG: ABC transporter permease [Halobacteriaceae archaeon]